MRARSTLVAIVITAFLAGCGGDDSPPPPPRYQPPPPREPSVCSAFELTAAGEPEPPAPGCEWLPAPRTPRTVTVTTDRPYCEPVFTTGEGVLFANVTVRPGEGYIWDFIALTGTAIREFVVTGGPADLFPGARTAIGSVHYEAPYANGFQTSRAMASWSPDGRHTQTETRYDSVYDVFSLSQVLLPSPARGIAQAQTEYSGRGWRVHVWIFDEQANLCGVPWLAASGEHLPLPRPIVGVDDDLNVLVLLDFTDYILRDQAARWYTIDGTPLTDEFPVSTGSAQCTYACSSRQPSFVPMIGGGLAYNEAQQWLAFFPQAQSRMEPPPDWLRDAFGHALYRVGRRGYVLAPYTQGSEGYPRCEDRLRFVSAAGMACGTMMLGDGWSCGASIWAGADGSVIQSGPYTPEDCHYAIWDRLLE